MFAIGQLLDSLKVRTSRHPERRRAELHASQGVKMGSGCTVFSGVGFGSEPYLVTLGDDVRVASGVQFITHDGGMHVLRRDAEFSSADLFAEITVGSNVFIGLNAVVLPGVSIGDNTVIGAGSVVTRDIPANTVAAGVPCRVIKSLNDYRASARPDVVMTKGLSATQKRAFLAEKFGRQEA